MAVAWALEREAEASVFDLLKTLTGWEARQAGRAAKHLGRVVKHPERTTKHSAANRLALL